MRRPRGKQNRAESAFFAKNFQLPIEMRKFLYYNGRDERFSYLKNPLPRSFAAQRHRQHAPPDAMRGQKGG